jgi:hypothetical protein
VIHHIHHQAAHLAIQNSVRGQEMHLRADFSGNATVMSQAIDCQAAEHLLQVMMAHEIDCIWRARPLITDSNFQRLQ